MILLDNKRSELIRKGFKELLQCIGCGNCLIHCPMYNTIGNEYAVDNYLGGKGIAYYSLCNNEKNNKLDLCLTCNKCKENCPLELDIPEIIKKIRSKGISSDIYYFLKSHMIWIYYQLVQTNYNIEVFILCNSPLNIDLSKIDTVILCGGLGTRLRPIISDQPKVLAKIGDTKFLDILINNISSYGLKNIILCVGHLKDHIKRHFDYYCNDHHDYYQNDYNIIFSEEEIPLGTGGALKNAEQLIKSDPFIVMNGDSICNVDFKEFLNFHLHKKALLSMVLSNPLVSNDYGIVSLDNSLRIVNFSEKSNGDNSIFINAGIYIMNKDIFSHMPKKRIFSLEYDIFPKLYNDECYGFVTRDNVIDIGTPERYRKAINLLANNKNYR